MLATESRDGGLETATRSPDAGEQPLGAAVAKVVGKPPSYVEQPCQKPPLAGASNDLWLSAAHDQKEATKVFAMVRSVVDKPIFDHICCDQNEMVNVVHSSNREAEGGDIHDAAVEKFSHRETCEITTADFRVKLDRERIYLNQELTKLPGQIMYRPSLLHQGRRAIEGTSRDEDVYVEVISVSGVGVNRVG